MVIPNKQLKCGIEYARETVSDLDFGSHPHRGDS